MCFSVPCGAKHPLTGVRPVAFLFVRAHRFFVFSTLAGLAQRLQRAIDTVAGIAQAGDDVGSLVKMVVDGAGIDMHIGIFLGQ